jgi:hypothetical protein
VTEGLTGITVNTILQQALPSRFLLTVLEAEGDTAVILANGSALQVRSEIPLQPGQMLLVSQEQGAGGEIRLRLLKDVTAMETTGQQDAPETDSQIDLLTALRLAELPATADAANKTAALLKTLGGQSLPNLLAAAAFLKTGLASDQILKAVASFLNSLLEQQDDNPLNEAAAGNSQGEALKQTVLTSLQELTDGLQRLAAQPENASDLATQPDSVQKLFAQPDSVQKLFAQPDGGQKLEASLQALVAKSGESVRQAIGGQVYTWTQNDPEGQGFYLPLHTILNNYGLRNCDLFICPPAGEQNKENDPEAWLFALTLETEGLGWMQFNLAYQNHQVAVQAVVEQPETKLALDDNWSLLAAGLGSLNLKLASQRCDLGQVHSQARSIQDLGVQFQQYNPFDISI